MLIHEVCMDPMCLHWRWRLELEIVRLKYSHGGWYGLSFKSDPSRFQWGGGGGGGGSSQHRMQPINNVGLAEKTRTYAVQKI